MSNKVWTWFKKLGHWLSVGATDANKFLQAAQQSNLISLIPGFGGAVGVGIGVFEKILAGNTMIEKAVASADAATTGSQKLAMATPNAIEAFVNYANAAGLKITDMSKAMQIAQATASLGADFLNILEPAAGDKLPTPNIPVEPVAPMVPTTVK